MNATYPITRFLSPTAIKRLDLAECTVQHPLMGADSDMHIYRPCGLHSGYYLKARAKAFAYAANARHNLKLL